MSAQAVVQALRALADPTRAAHNVKYFRAEPGGYGEGDEFLGVKVPQQRQVAKSYRTLDFDEIAELVTSPLHEVRLTGFFILIHRFRTRDASAKQRAYEFCLQHLGRLDNWDLVDSVAPHIFGSYMRSHPDQKAQLYTWARSADLWHRRIAMLTTQAFIRHDEFDDAIAIAELLLDDTHDLIHKAVGWMLREIGERDQARAESFLDAHGRAMPRTMLRYAIEKFPPARRKFYLKR